MATSHLIDHDAMTDEELLAATRLDDLDAYATLWRRHAAASRRIAASISSTLPPEDLVAEAYTRTLETIRRGAGPATHFRAYIITVIRRTAADWSKDSSQSKLVGTAEDLADLVEVARTSFDNESDGGLVIDAFLQLAPQDRMLLWYSAVEGYRPREMARIFKMSVGSVTVATHRARGALKKSWLQAYVNTHHAASPQCAEALEKMSGYVMHRRQTKSNRRVRQHLDECVSCQDVLDKVENADGQLRAALLPTAIALGYVGTSSAGAAGLAVTKSSSLLSTPVSVGISAVVVVGVAAAGLSLTARSDDDPAAAPAAHSAEATTAPSAEAAQPLGPTGEAAPAATTPPTTDAATSVAPSTAPARQADFVVGSSGTSTTPQAPGFGFTDGTVFRSRTPLLSGVASPGASITAVLSGGALGYKVITATADADGQWSFVAPELNNATFTLAAYQTVGSAARSDLATSTFSVADATATPAPAITTVDTGGQRYAPVLSGTGTPGATVQVMLNGVATTSLVNKGGAWSVNSPGGAVVGANTLSATQTLAGAAQPSTASAQQRFTLVAPSAVISQARSNSLTVQVSGLPGSTVGVTTSGSGPEHLVQSAQGSNSIQISPNSGTSYDPTRPPPIQVRYTSADGSRVGPWVAAG